MKNTIKLSYNHFMTPKTLEEAVDDRDIIGIFSKSKKDPSKLSVKEDIGDLMVFSDNATTFKEMVSTNKEYKLLLWSYLDDYENYIYTVWLNGVKFANIVKHLVESKVANDIEEIGLEKTLEKFADAIKARSEIKDYIENVASRECEKHD